jgi:hypothetical protein
MQTEKGPKGPTTRLLVPPLSLTFEISQQHKNRADVHVIVHSGAYCITHRVAEVFYDTFGELPVVYLDACMRWILWLGQLEAERRLSDPGQRQQLQFQFPGWPCNTSPVDRSADVEF